MEQVTCPDCGSGFLREEIKEQEFQLGSRVPVTLKATFPVLICALCGSATFDYRGERARALAMAEYFHRHEDASSIPEPYLSAHVFSAHHKKQLEHTGRAGCFYCLRFFDQATIVDWTDDGETALCPLCGIDAVLPATEEVTPEYLKEMQNHWFAIAKRI